MKRVLLHIDHLVLKGFRYEDRYEVGDALRAELGWLFASADAARDLESTGDVSRLNVGGVSVKAGAKPSRVGTLAARGIAREVKS